jgi:hydrogenase maturation protease
MTRRVLVAGVGNIFLGDDAFGCEVVRSLVGTPLAEGVEVVDFGIRGVHLAYQLLDGYDLLVLVDAAARGRPPGTVSLIDVDTRRIASTADAVGDGDAPLLDVHGMAPGAVLAMLGSLGGRIERVLVVGCEPQSVADGIGLSPAVRDAVPHAVRLVQQVVLDDHDEAKEVSNR